MKFCIAILMAVTALSGCAPKPTTSFYDQLFYLGYKSEWVLLSVNNDPKALNPSVKDKLIAELDSFLDANQKFSRLKTYRALNVFDYKLSGNALPGEMTDYDGDAVMVRECFRELLHDPETQHEPEAFGIKVDIKSTKDRAVADAKKLLTP